MPREAGPNPYQSGQTEAGARHSGLPAAVNTLAAVVTAGMFLAAARRFFFPATSIDGIAGAVMVWSIGFVVGGIFGREATPRVATVLVSLAFYLAAVGGYIFVSGDETILWAFTCMTIGLFVGAGRRTLLPVDADESGEDADVVRAEVVEGE